MERYLPFLNSHDGRRQASVTSRQMMMMIMMCAASRILVAIHISAHAGGFPDASCARRKRHLENRPHCILARFRCGSMSSGAASVCAAVLSEPGWRSCTSSQAAEPGWRSRTCRRCGPNLPVDDCGGLTRPVGIAPDVRIDGIPGIVIQK